MRERARRERERERERSRGSVCERERQIDIERNVWYFSICREFLVIVLLILDWACKNLQSIKQLFLFFFSAEE